MRSFRARGIKVSDLEKRLIRDSNRLRKRILTQLKQLKIEGFPKDFNHFNLYVVECCEEGQFDELEKLSNAAQIIHKRMRCVRCNFQFTKKTSRVLFFSNAPIVCSKCWKELKKGNK